MDELVGRRKPLVLEAGGVGRIRIPGIDDDNALAGALEIAECGAASLDLTHPDIAQAGHRQ
jgi:hypothetical protein